MKIKWFENLFSRNILNTKKKKSKLWRDASLKGYNAFKVYLIVTRNQEPVSYYISTGLIPDTTASYKLPKNSIKIGF